MLRASLSAPAVTEVRALVRRSTGVTHPKLHEIIHSDYADYSDAIAAFTGVDACFFCLGISVQQVPDEPGYRRIHQRFPVAAATMLRQHSPGAHFHYVSGGRAALDSRWMWARVKAEAERELMTGFGATCWRPAMIDGTPPSPLPAVMVVLRPVLRTLFKPFRSMYVMNEDIGRAMLQATRQGIKNKIIENAELRDLADAYQPL